MNQIRLHGPARFAWHYGMVFSIMFLLYAFANLGLAVLDSDFSGIGAPLIYGAYAVVHLMLNNAFKNSQSWGLRGLLVVYIAWLMFSAFAIFSRTGELDLLTAITVAVGSAGMVWILIRLRSTN